MDYTEFCHINGHVTSLTQQEIKTPLIVLETIYNKRNLTDFKTSLRDFFIAIYNDQLWRIKGAFYYFDIYIDLIKLLDALWLINDYRPELSTMTCHFHQLSFKPMNLFHDVFQGRIENNQKEEGHSTILEEFYQKNNLSTIKYYMYNYLQLGLNASYMSNDSYYYFSIEKTNVFTNLIDLERLIKEGQNIYNKNKFTPQKFRYRKHIKFASDLDHPNLLDYESIAYPMNYILIIYDHYIFFERISESLKLWKQSFFEKKFWHNAGSPGNILFLAHLLKNLIECFWLLKQKNDIIDCTIGEDLSNSRKKMYPTLNEEELSDPSKVIYSFFEYRKMHEWKTEIDSLTKNSLSSTEAIDMNKISMDFHHLLRFIEASHLIAY